MKRIVSEIMLTLLLIGMLTLALDIQPVKSDWTWTETIYIRADGSIDPSTAPISTVDNVTYTLTDNIVVDIFEDLIVIVVERNNIVVDGAGYTLQGSHWGIGINLSGRKNVTIKNIEIRQFIFGIYLSNSSDISIYNNNITHSEAIGIIVHLSSDNDVTTNNIKYNYIGIQLEEADNNCISGNQIVANGPGGGMFLLSSTNNSMFRNNITKNWIGIGLGSSKNNVITENVISANLGYDISISSSDNAIFHNDLNNRSQIFLSGSFSNRWDDGYPSGGNYWSDYTGVDVNGDGIGDTPYDIDENNTDRYPLMYPWSPLPVHNINTGLGYGTIQEAINANETLNGHTIFVESGTFCEHVIVNKSISLIGENRSTTIIDGSGWGIVITITANNVNITGFTIQKSGTVYPNMYGIYLGECTTGNNISYNIIANNNHGIDIIRSRGNTVSGNTVLSNDQGIVLTSSNNSVVSGNTVLNNSFVGIFLYGGSCNNTLSGNTVSNNDNGIKLSYNSNNNTIFGNTVSNNTRGIDLTSYEDNNTVSGNNITNNQYGIYLALANNNVFFHNNCVNNTNQVYDLSWDTPSVAASINVWDDGYPSGGNYWSDYTGVDIDGDGVGDTPYDIDVNNTDRYPLMHPWSSLPVHNINTGLGYATIQEAINANETLNGHTIFVEVGTYYEHITITKSLKLIGENSDDTIIDGDQIEAFLVVIRANNVSVCGFTLRNNGQTGVWLYDSSYTSICNNLIAGNKGHGIYMGDSLNSVILNNKIVNNSHTGIRFDWSSNCLIQMNEIINNGVAGIVFMSYTKSSVNNTIIENHITNNPTGVELSGCSDNSIYHNAFINNTQQVYSYNSLNTWDNGYPSGGNYWSDYVGVDVKNGPNQDLFGSDCIGDTPYTIDEYNQDRYPLMKPWTLMHITYTFPIVWGEETFTVSVESNSTVSSFYFSQPMKEMGFNVTGEAGTVGFCNVRIPKQLLYGEPWTLLIDGEPVSYTQTENETHSFLYFTYTHSTHEIRIIGTHVIEPPPSPPPPLAVSISPLSASILVGQSVTFTSTVAGGYTPYSYQWYLNGNPVSEATSDTWAFTPTTSGIYYVHLKVTDDTGNTTQSETARITVAAVPVGGYSVPIQLPTTAQPATIHISLLTILTAIFITIKRKAKRKH